jgi:transcriptional regulator with XRE-family HTH domain
MDAINDLLRSDLRQPELSEGYAESFQDAYIATQIKVLREQNNWTQADLAERLDTTQTAISRIENVNYSAWNIRTLKKLARAFRLRLKVSFETYGSLIPEIEEFSRDQLKRSPREEDPELNHTSSKRDPWDMETLQRRFTLPLQERKSELTIGNAETSFLRHPPGPVNAQVITSNQLPKQISREITPTN